MNALFNIQPQKSEYQKQVTIQNPDDPNQILSSQSVRKSYHKSIGTTVFSPQSFMSGANRSQGQYFSNLKKELKDQIGENDDEFINIEQNIDRLLDVHQQMSALLSDYDKKLLKVLERHEHDFLAAYKTHMTKVEKELSYLKGKAKDQEKRLAQDERILRLEKQLQWFQDELSRLQKKSEGNVNEIDMLTNKMSSMKEEKAFMEDQVKASKRQNKLLIVALNKTQIQRDDLQDENSDLQVQMVETKKAAVEIPSLEQSPFDITGLNSQLQVAQQFSQIQPNDQEQSRLFGDPKQVFSGKADLEKSFMASTEYPSEMNTSRFKPLESQFQNNTSAINNKLNSAFQSVDMMNKDLQNQMAMSSINASPDEFTPENVLQQFVIDLINSGRSDPEIVESIEQYYNKLSSNSDDEILRLREELEIQKALTRQLQADEVVIPAVDQDDLSNYFLECVYEQRKSLRHQLVTMRNSFKNPNAANNTTVNTTVNLNASKLTQNSGNGKTVSNVFNNSLLNTYINTVKTGSQEEIEQFSQIEKQKLVQLLVTNSELLNFMFDKMFKNKKSQKNQNQSNSQAMLNINQNMDLVNFEDNSNNNLNFNTNNQVTSYDLDNYNMNFQTQTRATFSPQVYYQPPSQKSKTVKASHQQIFGKQNSSDPLLAFNKQANPYERQGYQAPLKDRKQRSMLASMQNQTTDNVKNFDHSNTMNLQNNKLPGIPAYNPNSSDQQVNDAYFSASPLLVKDHNNQTVKVGLQQSNILLSRIKESNFNSNILSQLDTDMLQQQYLSQDMSQQNSQNQKFQDKEVIYSRRSKLAELAEKNIFPDMQGRMGPYDDTYNNSANLLQNKSLMMKSKMMDRRGKSTRPMMQVKNGKLLIVKAGILPQN
ncbi:UNKNOWN [Stylonychia lemnae]|uniref:Myosin heavy chain n=1 Tax=Stylonychia lemnae TaxID=5949 RepID=A0A078B517_STYLE|nr:UNKNOWN [Stylonychia lemnae]|eukprot:CDW88332.1 UNKNOWN [Stylonychia lemnae]